MTTFAHILHRFDQLSRAHPACASTIDQGTIRDYHALAPFHYRSPRPATIARILRASDAGETVGVLVVSMPTLNGSWRALAWPGRFTGDPRARAARLNADLRTISRVIIDPRYRGLGLATRLVRSYLDAPLTPATEAVAAMGAYCPFFARAGMHEIRPPRPARDKWLEARLAQFNLSPLDLLRAAPNPDVTRALNRWADWSRATRKLIQGDPPQLARAAAMALLAQPAAYAHGLSAGEHVHTN